MVVLVGMDSLIKRYEPGSPLLSNEIKRLYEDTILSESVALLGVEFILYLGAAHRGNNAAQVYGDIYEYLDSCFSPDSAEDIPCEDTNIFENPETLDRLEELIGVMLSDLYAFLTERLSKYEVNGVKLYADSWSEDEDTVLVFRDTRLNN